MEQEPSIEEQPTLHGNEPEKKKSELSLSMAIVTAGVLIGIAMVGSSLLKGSTPSSKKAIATQLGLNAKKLQACVTSGETKDRVLADTASGDKAFAHMKPEERGTPYTVAITKSGVKIGIPGAQPYEIVKGMTDGLLAGKVPTEENITIDPVTADDHILGSMDAEIIFVEYSDFDCPFCYRFHPTMHRIKEEYSDKVAWVYRHYPLNIHPNAGTKAQAAECAALQGGNEAFWKYGDALFEALAPEAPKFDTTTL